MKVMISKTVRDLYQESHKNYEYALESIMNGLDPETYIKAIKDIKKLESVGEKVEVNISDSATEMLKELLSVNEIESNTMELLLWVAVLFPEI